MSLLGFIFLTVFYSLFIYRKTLFIILLLPIVLLLPNTMVLVDMPSLPVLRVNDFLFFLIGISPLLTKAYFKIPVYKTLKPLYLYFIVFFCLSVLQPGGGILTEVARCLTVLIPLYLISGANEDVLRKSIIAAIIFGIFAFLFSFLSYISEFNPYANLMEHFLNTERVQIIDYRNDLRGYRETGFASHPMTMGASFVFLLVASVYLFFYCTYEKRRGQLYKLKLLALLVFFLSVIGIYFVNSRTPILFLFVFLFLFWFKSNLNTKILIFLIVLLFSLFLLPFTEMIHSKLLSILNIFEPNVGDDQHGSTISMRLSQLLTSYEIFLSSPIYGHGLGYTRYLVENNLYPTLLNTESIIYVLMIDTGSVGLIGYFGLFVGLLFIVKKYLLIGYARNTLYGLTIGYLVFVIATGEMYTFQTFMITFFLIFNHSYKRQVGGKS